MWTWALYVFHPDVFFTSSFRIESGGAGPGIVAEPPAPQSAWVPVPAPLPGQVRGLPV